MYGLIFVKPNNEEILNIRQQKLKENTIILKNTTIYNYLHYSTMIY